MAKHVYHEHSESPDRPVALEELASQVIAKRTRWKVNIDPLVFGLLFHAEKPERAEEFREAHLATGEQSCQVQLATVRLLACLKKNAEAAAILETLYKKYPTNSTILCEVCAGTAEGGQAGRSPTSPSEAMCNDPLCPPASYRVGADGRRQRQSRRVHSSRHGCASNRAAGLPLAAKAAELLEKVLANDRERHAHSAARADPIAGPRKRAVARRLFAAAQSGAPLLRRPENVGPP